MRGRITGARFVGSRSLNPTGVVLALVCAQAAQAHHSFAMFDQAKKVTLKAP